MECCDIIFFDNGTINSTRSPDTFLETTRSGKGDDIVDFVDVLKERAWYKGVYTPMSSRQGRKARGVSNVGNSDSTTTSSRGAHGRSDESENEIVAMEQEKGLVEYIDRGSVWLEYSDNRGDQIGHPDCC
jgi:hypothetical protein